MMGMTEEEGKTDHQAKTCEISWQWYHKGTLFTNLRVYSLTSSFLVSPIGNPFRSGGYPICPSFDRKIFYTYILLRKILYVFLYFLMFLLGAQITVQVDFWQGNGAISLVPPHLALALYFGQDNLASIQIL